MVQSHSAALNLQGSGFKDSRTDVPKRLVVACDGLEKCGKTNFGLSAPGSPRNGRVGIGILNTDIGLEGVVQKFQSEKKVVQADFRLDVHRGDAPQAVAEKADKVWSDMLKTYKWGLANLRSIVVDTATEVWEVLRMARFGKLTQVMPHHYGPVNAEYREFIRLAYEQEECNVIFSHKVKDEWIDGPDGKGRRTGNLERTGFKETGFLVQVNVRCWKDPLVDGIDKFRATITDCRQTPEAEGQTLEGEQATFPFVANLVFPEVDIETWL